MTFVDQQLSYKIERTEAALNIAFVESRARLFPVSAAAWIESGGAFAMFDGVQSPLTQTFGLGMTQPVAAEAMELFERFFERHGAPALHEISPLAHESTAGLLSDRGYRPLEYTNVMFLPLATTKMETDLAPSGIHTRALATSEECDRWAETSATAWSTEMPEYRGFLLELGTIAAHTNNTIIRFIAEMDGVPAGTALLGIHEEVAFFGGASTLPEFRRRGVQHALLEARIAFSREKKCSIAAMGARPGSQSQKNAERRLFRVAYTRTKFGKI